MADSTSHSLADSSPDATPDSPRREFLRRASLGLVGLPFAPAFLSTAPGARILAAAPAAASAPAAAAATTVAPPALAPLNRFPRMMQEWLVNQVRTVETHQNAKRAALKTQADAEAYVASVRERIRISFGPEPERTPLNARVTRTVERDAYKIEHIIFESRPGLLVTGNLYVPVGRTGQMPGVIGVCGHSLNGKAADAYQSFAQGLARLGYVCFIIDPIGQGERFQYLAEGTLKSRFSPGVSEHIQSGNQQALVGEFLGAWFAWDGIRALDYLLTRPEVDPKQIGLTGNSGGGTQTTWICGLDPRFTMAAPACFVTTFRRNAENELPADTEQCPPAALALGLDHSDFLAAMAPKPVVIVAQEKDFFDVRGSMEAYERLKQLYTLLGKPENIQLHIGSDYHGYSRENREAMYRFFNKVTGVSQAATEPDLVVEKDETLWCTTSGQISELKPRTVASLTAEAAKQLATNRPRLTGSKLVEAVKSTLKLHADALGTTVPDYRILRPSSGRKYPAKGSSTYAVETEPGIQALVTRLHDASLVSRPPQGGTRAILYVAHRSADAELRSEHLVAELVGAAADAAVYACDVRGIGESQPDTCGADQFLKPYGSDYFLAAHAIMLDRPYLGQKVGDLLRVVTWLKAQGHQEIHLAGRGWGALAAAFAALLSPAVTQVTLKNALASYEIIATTEDYKWPYATLLPGVLKRFDLPDIYAALQDKKLENLEPWGALDGMGA